MNEIYIKHFQINETKIFSKKITKQQNEFSWMKQQNEFSRNEIFFLKTMIAFYFHLTYREFAKMTINYWFFCFENRSINEFVTTTINNQFFYSSKSIDIQSIIDFFVFRINQSINKRFRCFRINQFIHQIIFTIIIFLKRWNIV